MKRRFLKVHPSDNVLVALTDLPKGEMLDQLNTVEAIPAKHKIAMKTFYPGDPVIMYGIVVGKAVVEIAQGKLITTSNIHHATQDYSLGERKTTWNIPDISAFKNRVFKGYHRNNGRVGTANHWIVIPLVFCENRNLQILKDALQKDLGYFPSNPYRATTNDLIQRMKKGSSIDDIMHMEPSIHAGTIYTDRIFENVDGIKFLEHDGGCGGTRQDAEALCGLLAGYIVHPNVAGVTVLSLGCQHAQVAMLEAQIHRRDPHFNKPMFILEQQKIGKESVLMDRALKQTFAGLMMANEQSRKEAPISELCIGLECGGSDGFSGISANPAIGYTSDLLVAAGGAVILSEFPELCGVEQELSDRCFTIPTAEKFMELMKTY
ncbi:MAG: UxaA family hydrolase, partial [Chitinophagaceae bacterium]